MTERTDLVTWDDTDDAAWDDTAVVQSTSVAAAKSARATKKNRPKKSRRAPAKEAAAVDVRAAHKIGEETLRGKVMYQAVHGRRRIWACDGEYVFFRRPRDSDGREAKDANGAKHAAITRHEKFLSNGDYVYVETQDDVEICKVTEQSPFFRNQKFLGEMSEGDIQRACVKAAVKRDWVLYTDTLEELAGRIKAKWDSSLAGKVWADRLTYINYLIQLRRGPTPQECAGGMANVRRARGAGGGKMILLAS